MSTFIIWTELNVSNQHWVVLVAFTLFEIAQEESVLLADSVNESISHFILLSHAE